MTTEIKTKVSADIEEIPLIKTEMRATARPPATRHMETIRLTKRLAVSDAEGKTIYDTGEIPSHSFVVAFIQGLWACFTGATPTPVDIFGVRRRMVLWGSGHITILRLNSGAGDTRFGPVVGTGTKPLSNHDFRLDAQIGHGTGTNQLLHGASTLLEPREITGALIITLQRTFTNHSTATITISECGIYCLGNTAVEPFLHCIVRDLISPPIDLPLMHTLLLEYRIQTRV